MKIIDTHAHLNLSEFDSDREELIGSLLNQGVWVINVGTRYDSSKKAVEIARPGVYASVGLHPLHLDDGFDYEKYRELARSDYVVAIGETGLDTHSDSDNQEELFEKQIELAKELSLPVIIHCRKAHKKMIEILSRHQVTGVIHSFTGNWQEALSYLDMGFYLGFNGIVFKLNLSDVIERVPLDRVLVETDCPYLTPPKREGRNDPSYITDIIEYIAKLRGEEYHLIRETTVKNAIKLFELQWSTNI